MSKAYYFVKNFNWQEIKNLLCYGAKHPEVLSSHQKLTRLYRATLRKQQDHFLYGLKADFDDYNREITKSRKDFYHLLTLKPDDIEYQTLMQKYEQLQEDLYDPQMMIDDCRPYSNVSDRYLIWPDEVLSYDPFGFYSDRLMSDKRPYPHAPYYDDYPVIDSHWNMWETFPEGFDDHDYQADDAELKNKQYQQQQQRQQ